MSSGSRWKLPSGLAVRTSEMYIVYILQSDKDRSYYIGSTEDIKKRLLEHNKGYSKYTKNKRPWRLAYGEEYATLSESRKREYYLKSLKSKKAIEKLIKTAPSSSG